MLRMPPDTSRLFVCIMILWSLFEEEAWGFMRTDLNNVATEYETEIKVWGRQSGKSGRQIRSMNRFPDELSIELMVNKTVVHLKLFRNHHISHLVPVTVERNGNILHQNLQEEEDIGYYFDLTNGSSFMIQHSKRIQSGFEFFGSFHIGDQPYLVQPPDDNHKTHTVYRAPQETIRPYGETLYKNEESIPEVRENVERKIAKRFLQAVTYEVEVLIVVDFSVHTFWRDRAPGSIRAEKDLNGKKNLRQYYALLLNAMDLRYKSVTGRGYEIKLLFAGLHIADTAAGASWTEDIKQIAFDPPKVDSSVALKNFKVWENHHSHSLPGHDHAMLFTKYDLKSTGLLDNLGKAYLGGLCNEYEVSVIEDTFAVTTATTSAHELGHNLNAKHDGEDNSCTKGNGYVMDAVMEVGNDTTFNKRLWIFSNCSLDYFDAFIKDLNRHHSNCLSTRSASYNASALNEFANEFLGQIYPPDDQCENVNGKGSYMCRQMLDFDYSRICGYFGCSKLENNGFCFIQIPWEGTTCGNGKVCYKGSCIPSVVAPSNISKTCIFGDQPGQVAKRGKTCQDLINVDSHHFECYNYDEECCETCAAVTKLYTKIANCRYGDKARWCSTLKPHECYNNHNICCSTCKQFETGTEGCKYGDKASDCGTLVGWQCYSNTDTCCSHCQQFATGMPGCSYGDKASWCSTLKPHECYSNDDNCCSTCKQFHTGIAGCEYGDKDPTCNSSECAHYDLHSQTVVCCSSCAKSVVSSIVG